MKIHTKKKQYRAAMKADAKAGRMNNANGQMVMRAGCQDTSMKRDYHPQQG